MAQDQRGWEGCPKCGYMGGMDGWRFVKWDTGEDAFAAQQVIQVLRDANRRLNGLLRQAKAENEALRVLAGRPGQTQFEPVTVPE